jgi:membrane associated rhomboid family serine protease
MAGVEQAIEWQAHIGGFLAGSPGIRRIRSHSDLDGRRPE